MMQLASIVADLLAQGAPPSRIVEVVINVFGNYARHISKFRGTDDEYVELLLESKRILIPALDKLIRMWEGEP